MFCTPALFLCKAWIPLLCRAFCHLSAVQLQPASRRVQKQERGTCPSLMIAATCGVILRQPCRPTPRYRHAHAAIIALWQQRARRCHCYIITLPGNSVWQDLDFKHVEGKREGSEGDSSGCRSERDEEGSTLKAASLFYFDILTRKISAP